MNVIIGMSDLIRTDNLDKQQKEFFGDIKKMSKALLQIINDILDFSKIEANKMDLSPVHFNLMELLDNISSLHLFTIQSKGLDFQYNAGPDVPRIVYGDDVRIRQILTNILNNAIKYTREGSVCFRVERSQEDGEEYIAFIVEDTGIGIRKDDLPKVFGAFEQLDARHNRGIAGTGLGLPICKRLVELMNGRIEVESEYGKGSVFTILLPLPEGDPAKVEGVGAMTRMTAAKGVKVLVVDDNAINLKVAIAYLARHGIKADTAASGAEALRQVREKQYHLVFMDHMMPEMNGLEAALRIRALGGWYETAPVVALSANAVTGVRELFLKNGMNDFISKPIDAGELNRMLARWLPPDMLIRDIDRDSEEDTSSPDDSGQNEGTLIDRAEGIANSADSEELYQQLLADFQSAHGTDLGKINAALETEDYKSAHRFAHTLKTTSALIGAKALSKAALALEMALAGNSSVPEHSILETLKTEFEAVMAELSCIMPRSADSASRVEGKLDKTRALAFIKKLEPLLDSGSTDSMNLLDDIREILAPAGEKYADLIARIENFDFAEAAEILAQIRKEIVG
jgi:CheY-like chemotaxis protein/anti-sigma regulatory factor (Ser/Thr protein kinase)